MTAVRESLAPGILLVNPWKASSGAQLALDASAKVLKAGIIVDLEGGDVTIDSADDAVHSDTWVHTTAGTLTLASSDDGLNASGGTGTDSDGAATGTTVGPGGGMGGGMGGGGGDAGSVITLSGGTVTIDAEGDGFDSNGSVTISGGSLVVNGPEQSGNGALDVNGTLVVTGGEVLATGSAGMMVSPDASSTQGWISSALSSTLPAGTDVTITDADGTTVTTFTTSKTIAGVVYAGPEITSGESYTLTADGTTLATVTAGTAAAGGGDMRGGR